jgi:hypothetical protein
METDNLFITFFNIDMSGDVEIGDYRCVHPGLQRIYTVRLVVDSVLFCFYPRLSYSFAAENARHTALLTCSISSRA